MKLTSALTSAAAIPSGLIARRFGRPMPIKAISYSVTFRCNMSCTMCDNDKIAPVFKKRESELTADEIGRAFADPMVADLDLIRFTGGEPFIKQDLAEIILAIHRVARVGVFYITTNGLLTDRIKAAAERLAAEGATLHIQVSLDGSAPVHDRIRGISGAHAAAMKTIMALKTIANRRPNLHVGVNQTIGPKTAGELFAVARLARTLGIGHNIYVAYEDHESFIEPENIRSVKFGIRDTAERHELERMYQYVDEVIGEKKLVETGSTVAPSELMWRLVEGYVIAGNRSRVLEGIADPKPTCLALTRYLRILPDGGIIPCTLKPHVVGSIRSMSFSEILSGPTAASVRKKVARCEGCWVECDIIPSAIYSGDIIRWWLAGGRIVRDRRIREAVRGLIATLHLIGR